MGKTVSNGLCCAIKTHDALTSNAKSWFAKLLGWGSLLRPSWKSCIEVLDESSQKLIRGK